MGRDLTAGVSAELASEKVRWVMFYEGEFTSGFLRLWGGLGDKVWDGKTWSGAGNLLGMSEVTETAGIVSQRSTLSLSGIPSSLLSLVHQAKIDGGKPGNVWLGTLDASDAVIADPYLAFSGRLDVPEIALGGETCTIAITYESRLADLLRPRVFRYDHETQQIFYPGDRGFEYVASLQDQVLEW